MTQQVHNTVFISYRRSTSSYLARAIYMDLKQHGYDVFMDVQNIDSGQFDGIILRQIEARAHFLILCTPGTFDRINDPGDWLRREIEHAMLHKRNIVPILASDFKFDAVTTQRFAGKLAELPRYNALNAPHDYFEEALERLRTRFLKLSIGVEIAATPAADVRAVAAKQAEVESQSVPTSKQLTAEEYFNRGLARDDNSAEELADYTEAIRINPRFAKAYYTRGIVHKAQGDLDSALVDYNHAIRLDPQYAIAYNNRAFVRKVQGDLDGALADYNDAIRLDPQYVLAYTNRGVARKAQGDLDGAIADYSEAIRLDPQYAAAYNNRGFARQAKGDLDGALADYNEALRLNPKYAEAYNNRGNAHYAKRDYDGALADYNEALRLNPQYAKAYYGRGNSRKQKGDNRLALDDFLRYVELTRANPDPYWLAEAEKHIRELKKKLRIK